MKAPFKLFLPLLVLMTLFGVTSLGATKLHAFSISQLEASPELTLQDKKCKECHTNQKGELVCHEVKCQK